MVDRTTSPSERIKAFAVRLGTLRSTHNAELNSQDGTTSNPPDMSCSISCDQNSRGKEFRQPPDDRNMYSPHITVKQTDHKFQEKMLEIKLSTPVEIVCQGCPGEFANYLNHCRGLRFEEEPDYTYLRQIFTILLRHIHQGNENDLAFDWTMLPTQTATTSTQ